MKGLICVLVLALNYISFPQSYPHLFDLRGLEDSLGNTHLFYRYGYPQFFNCWSKSIYHYDLSTNVDTIFIHDFGYEVYQGWGCEGNYIYDYEFFDNDPAKFIFGGYDLWIDPIPILIRYDGEIPIYYLGGITEIEISEQNDTLVYAALNGVLLKSSDGGYNFDFLDSLMFIDNSMISLSRNDDSQIYGINDKMLVRSEDEGHSYIIVDDSEWDNYSELFYDPDGNHIYGVSNYYNYPTRSYSSKIYVSSENGNPFTWTNKITRNLPIRFTHDEYQSGEIYYSQQRDIYKSTDYAKTFEHYKRLDRNITGLYKKSGSDILYASTPLKIYEITPDTINTIKSLPIPASEFGWYPLDVGNRWIYDKAVYVDSDTLNWISIFEVEAIVNYDNKFYSQVLVTDIGLNSLSSSGTHHEYFRTDSLNGIIYKVGFTNDSISYEEIYMDLLAEVGDTITVGYRQLYLESEVPFSLFGLKSLKRTFLNDQTPIQDIKLLKGLGLIYEFWWELGSINKDLQGCIINGVVYGDTTVVSVDDEEPKVASSFMLE
jgi:hypothetical protein